MSFIGKIMQGLGSSDVTVKFLKEEVERLNGENEALRSVDTGLRKRNEELQEECDELRREYDDLRENHKNKCSELDCLRQQNTDLRTQNGELEEQKQQLTRRLEIYEQATAGQEEGDFCPEDLEKAKKKADLMNSKIDVLNLEVKTYNCLAKKYLLTIGDVCECRASELLECLRGFGVGCLNDLNYNLGKLGLKLRDEAAKDVQMRINKLMAPSRAKLMTLDDLDLPIRTYNEAKRAKNVVVRTLADLESLGWRERDIRQMFKTEACADEFITKLKALDFPVK